LIGSNTNRILKIDTLLALVYAKNCQLDMAKISYDFWLMVSYPPKRKKAQTNNGLGFFC
jgi:hypothetical protein